MADESYTDIKKKIFLTDDAKEYIRDNPEGLTKEGAEYSVNLWKLSSNKYVLRKYAEMVKHCKNFEPSGILEDGRVILARTKNKFTGKKEVTWAEKMDTPLAINRPGQA